MNRVLVGILICAGFAFAVNFALDHLTPDKGGGTREAVSMNVGLSTTFLKTNTQARPLKKTILRPSSEINQEALVQADQKVKVLREILTSKNDNDPRLDNDFVNLTEIEKERLRQEYKTMPRENFNDKGTVVYLLGRNIKTPRDIEFLSGVLSEAPCASMTDCAKPAPAVGSEAVQKEAGEGYADQITLAYPQIVSLKSLKPYIDAPPTDAALKQSVFEALRTGANSKNNVVSKMARDYTKKYLSGERD